MFIRRLVFQGDKKSANVIYLEESSKSMVAILINWYTTNLFPTNYQWVCVRKLINEEQYVMNGKMVQSFARAQFKKVALKIVFIFR